MKPARALVGSLAVVAGLAIGYGFVDMAFGSTADQYLLAPADAGALAKGTAPPPLQRYAWSVGFTSGRVLAYYWDLPPRTLGLRALADDAVADHELVLVNLGHLPDWYPDRVPSIAEEGRYAVVSTGELRARLGP